MIDFSTPRSGTTTLVRDLVQRLPCSPVLLDTSQELSGDGTVPHPLRPCPTPQPEQDPEQ